MSLNDSSLLNICFHGVGRPGRQMEPGEERYWVSKDVFCFVLDSVVDRPDVRISFDDGNASDIDIGLPELVERGLTATFFVLAGRLGSAGSLQATDLAVLTGQGMTVGNHGMDHVPWRSLDSPALDRELVEARGLIAAASGQPVTDAALPLGRYSRPVLQALRESGYQRAFSSDRAVARPNAWLQPRFSIRKDDSATFIERSVLGPQPMSHTLRYGLVSTLKRLRWR